MPEDVEYCILTRSRAKVQDQKAADEQRDVKVKADNAAMLELNAGRLHDQLLVTALSEVKCT